MLNVIHYTATNKIITRYFYVLHKKNWGIIQIKNVFFVSSDICKLFLVISLAYNCCVIYQLWTDVSPCRVSDSIALFSRAQNREQTTVDYQLFYYYDGLGDRYETVYYINGIFANNIRIWLNVNIIYIYIHSLLVLELFRIIILSSVRGALESKI